MTTNTAGQLRTKIAPYTLYASHYNNKMENNKDKIIQGNMRKLCEACRDGNIEVVDEILSNKMVDINGRDGKYTPLIYAVNGRHLDIVKRILQHTEVDINGRDSEGCTPLISAVNACCLDINAVNSGFLDIVKTLLEVPELQLGNTMETCTALHFVCMYICFYSRDIKVSIMKLLCQDSRCSPGIVNNKTNLGYTALMMAVYNGCLDIVKELDKEGTDFFIKDFEGTTLIETARRKEDRAEVLEYLLERNKVDSLKVIAAHNVARYVRNKAEVEAMKIPVTVKHFLAGFVNDDE